jgi:2-phospho-L-lactate guanylyltransferase
VHKLCVVIPMKDPAFSKQRLSPHLPASVRKALAIKLFKKTVMSLNGAFPQWQKLVVTPSLYIADLATSLGCKVIFEAKGSNLNTALTQATEWSMTQGFSHQLILPADIARLEEKELNSIAALASGDTSVVIGSAYDGGTNALCTTPPNAIGFAFGKSSSYEHHQAALEKGLKCVTVQPKYLSQDIDHPDDLRHVNDVVDSLIA